MKVNEGYIGKFSKNGNEYIHTGGVNETQGQENCGIVTYLIIICAGKC